MIEDWKERPLEVYNNRAQETVPYTSKKIWGANNFIADNREAEIFSADRQPIVKKLPTQGLNSFISSITEMGTQLKPNHTLRMVPEHEC